MLHTSEQTKPWSSTLAYTKNAYAFIMSMMLLWSISILFVNAAQFAQSTDQSKPSGLAQSSLMISKPRMQNFREGLWVVYPLPEDTHRLCPSLGS